MNFNKPSAENPEYKGVKKEDVIEAVAQALVDDALIGSNQDFISRRRPHLLADTRGKVAQTYEKYKDMFENFSGDTSGDTPTDMVASRAEILIKLFEKEESVDLSVGGDVLDGKFSEANSNQDAAALYVMDLAGTDDIEKIDNFGKQLKNAEALIDIFKATDPFSYSKFQEALISGDLPAAVAEIKNFRERQLGGGKEGITA